MASLWYVIKLKRQKNERIQMHCNISIHLYMGIEWFAFNLYSYWVRILDKIKNSLT